jgi:hypothetical protein
LRKSGACLLKSEVQFSCLILRAKRRLSRQEPVLKAAQEMLKPGDTAPEFSLKTDKGDLVTLSGLRGKKILLWFYAEANSPG